jgi:hypothetical protein
MYRLRTWAILAALGILAGNAKAADPEDSVPVDYDRGAAGFSKWNGGHPEPPKSPPVSPQVAAAKARERDTVAALRAQEEANLLRRMKACERLRELAVQTGDESLEQLADELEKKAGAVFTNRTSALADRLIAVESDQQTAKREGKR